MHRKLPQSLNLWHNGAVILSSPGNTGVPAAPTQLGTFPVFEHIPVGTMSGTNPDGRHYNDPGIRWISYFNHGEAIHAFNRALVRHAAEPRLRRAAARRRGEGLALHADRHARHGRGLSAQRRPLLGAGAHDAARAVVAGAVPRVVQARDRHGRAGVRRVDEAARADVEADVADAVEEDEVAGRSEPRVTCLPRP